MNQQINKKNKWIISFILCITIIIYFMYIYYYYGSITWKSFIKHTVISINLLGKYIRVIIDKIMSNSVALNIIVATPLLIWIGNKINIQALINSLTNIEIGSIKVVKEGVKELKKENDESVEQMKDKCGKVPRENESLENKEKKSEILQLILDNPNLVGLIDKFLNKSRGVSIPISLIGYDYKLEDISKLFNYEIRNSSVRINSIKKDIEVLLIEVYNDLKRRGLIYSENSK